MKFGSIATGSKGALITAEDILKEGGNAFDAGIGAVFTSMVSEFALTGAGGGGILMGMEEGQLPMVYDFFVDCPINNDSEIDFKKISVDFGNTAQDFHIGKGSTAIPGNIEGLLSIHQNKGKLPLGVILQPAIDLARDGIVLSKYQAYINSLIKPILTHSEIGKKLFIEDGKFLEEGSTFKNSEFANFLQMLIKYGKDFFYKGEGAEVIEKFYLNGGYINKQNLNSYKMHTREPLHINIGGYDIFTNPPPSYGGTLMVFLFNLLKRSNSLNSDIIKLVKAMELTSMARNEVCNNPNNEMEISNCLNDNIFNKYLNCFMDDNFIGDATKLSGFGSTTHVSVMDKKGNAVSITTTNGEGSGHFISEFGIMMNNMLGEEDLNPFGFHKWKTVRRLPSMISPIIITKNNKPEIILGSGGSNRIRSANIQVIINLLIKKMSLEDAVSKSRIHLEGNNLYYEPEMNIPSHKDLSHIKHIPFENKNLFFGGVNAVSISEAVGDERRGGVGEIF